MRRLLASSCLCLLCIGMSVRAADEMPPTWPDPASFPSGQATAFRLPFFVGLLTYGDETKPLYNMLYVPAGYDKTRAYPLCIRFQPQGGKPETYEFQKMSNDDAIVLGVSWPLSKPSQGDTLHTITSDDYIFAATAHWVISNFNIDRNRVFVGGFSAGGWAASANGMLPAMQYISTHFFITGAGLRGKYKLELFKGSPVFVGVGTQDMNYGSGKAAADKLKSSGFSVTYFEELGIGHEIGPKTWEAAIEWWKKFDPRLHVDEWMKEAASLEVKDKNKACEIYAKVAVLGEKDERGKAARAKLEGIEGKALEAYEKAYALLFARDYLGATKAFQDASKEAMKARSGRLAKLCKDGSDEVAHWWFCEEAMAMEEAWFSGRVFESYLIACDGAMRWPTILKEWAGLFKDESKHIEADATAAAQRDGARAKAQQSLVMARVNIWMGKPESARKSLETIAKDFDGKPEGADAKMLILKLPAPKPAVGAADKPKL